MTNYIQTIPNYHPPQDYRRPTKTQEKVYVPVNDYPEINFSMIANPLTFLTMLPLPLGLLRGVGIVFAWMLCPSPCRTKFSTHALPF